MSNKETGHMPPIGNKGIGPMTGGGHLSGLRKQPLLSIAMSQEAIAKELYEALKLSVRQNGCDMLLTGEELRKCESTVAAYEQSITEPLEDDHEL